MLKSCCVHAGAARNLLVALLINLAFAAIELLGGWFTNSVSIITDALHDFGDALALGLAWYLERVALRPRDRFFTYGYKRFSLLGALLVSFVLIFGIAFTVREALERLVEPQPVKARGMLAFALLGIAANGFAAWWLHRGRSPSERAIFLHLLEDVLGWLAVLVTSAVLLFWPLFWLDPLLSLLIAAFIFYNAAKNLAAVSRILLMATPAQLNPELLIQKIELLPQVQKLEDLHLWTLDGSAHVATLQIVVTSNLPLAKLRQLKQKVRACLAEHGIHHSTIEFCTRQEHLDQPH